MDDQSPTPIDPRLTIIRSREIGEQFYDGVVSRIVAKPQQPSGVLFHFSGSFEDEFFVVSVYRDFESATETFAEFTGPEIENEVKAGGSGKDVARHEFPVASLAIGEIDQYAGFRWTEPGEFRASMFLDDALHRQTYLAASAAANFPDEWPEGMLFHVAGLFGDRWGVIDIWRGDADPTPFYRDRIEVSVRSAAPELSPSVVSDRHWIELHTLSVDPEEIGQNKRYLRDR
jgi:hypothetical protein